MKIPYVIDNNQPTLSSVLNYLLASRDHFMFDVATAYFNVGAFAEVRGGLRRLKKFRLLLGTELASGEDLGVKPRAEEVKLLEPPGVAALRSGLDAASYNREQVELVTDLIDFLRLPHVEVRHQPKSRGFLHAKCYLFYGPRDGQQLLFDPRAPADGAAPQLDARIRPIVAIVGSSNFTRAGLTINSELNTVHQLVTSEADAVDPPARQAVEWVFDREPNPNIVASNQHLLKSEVGARAIMDLKAWFDRHWAQSDDFKERLIEILDASKFGAKKYEPWEVYLKALYEYFKDDLEKYQEAAGTRSAVELASFQEDAVHKARRILDRYHGVMVADSVGLGKTWIGKKLLEDYAYHLRLKALVVCPASLRAMWTRTLRESAIAAEVVSQESLATADFDPAAYGGFDVVLVDESHNFRNARSQRYEALDLLLSRNGGLGVKSQARKKVILLTATPINNSVMDLYHQINLIARNDPQYFQAAGIADLFRYFVAARRESARQSEAASLFNLLEEVVIRRTRSFIRDAYPEALVNGQLVRFPERRLVTERYDLETVFEGLYSDIVDRIGGLTLAPYNLDSYRKDAESVDEMVLGRGQALVGIFKSRFLKRLESSIEAFRKSVRRALEFQKTFRTYLLEGRLLNCSDFRRLAALVARGDEDDEASPASLMQEIEADADAKAWLESLPTVDLDLYDRKRLRRDVDRDVAALERMWADVQQIGHEHDAKYAMLLDLLTRLKGKKVLVFSYYRDTARYVYERLRTDLSDAKTRKRLGSPRIHCLDSGVATKDRLSLVARFAPHASERPELAGTDQELDVLISTDVLSEGHNLQDCGHLVNYDLHWNPTRMVQRAGRIDRIGSTHAELCIHNVFPEAGLEKLLGLVQSLSQKIEDINRNGFLDASVLGEAVSPRTFNTLRRIEDEDGAVLTETENLAELASPESMLQVLRQFLLAEGYDKLKSLPDGIRSCLTHPEREGHFFYFQSRIEGVTTGHFWRFVDARGEVIDNRLVIGGIIACDKKTPRATERADAFVAQERAIEDILQTQRHAVARAEVTERINEVQNFLLRQLAPFARIPPPGRETIKRARELLLKPLPATVVRTINKVKTSFEPTAAGALQAAQAIIEAAGNYGGESAAPGVERRLLTRDDLYLICFEEVVRAG